MTGSGVHINACQAQITFSSVLKSNITYLIIFFKYFCMNFRKMTVTSGKIDNVAEIFLKLESNDQAAVNEIQQFVGEQYQDGEAKLSLF